MNLQKLKKKTQLGNSGFSLVELIIVIAIMAILIAVLAPMFIRYVERSRISRDVNAAGEMVQALKTMISDPTLSDKLPTSSLVATWSGGGGVTLNSADDEVLEAFSAIIPDSGTIPASSNTFAAADEIVLTIVIGSGEVTVEPDITGGTAANQSYMIALLSGIN